jgi:hypothetical protein
MDKILEADKNLASGLHRNKTKSQDFSEFPAVLGCFWGGAFLPVLRFFIEGQFSRG